MKSFMESQKDSVFMKSNHAGVNKVINSDGDYAFLMESNSIQYQIERMCDLIQVMEGEITFYLFAMEPMIHHLTDHYLQLNIKDLKHGKKGKRTEDHINVETFPLWTTLI